LRLVYVVSIGAWFPGLLARVESDACMRSFEDLRVVAFVAGVVAVYVLAAGIVLRWVFRKLRGEPPSTPPARTWFRRVVLTLAGLGILCFGYGYFCEPYWLSITHTKVTSAKLPKGAQPIRIVHISDLHCDPKPRLEGGLDQAIARERPDLIVFTGDSINSLAGLPIFKACLTRVAKVAPTFVVRGNWDAWYWHGVALFGQTGAQELDGSAAKLDVRGFRIWVAGVAVEHERSLEKSLSSIPADAFKVVLYHYPDLIKEVAALKVDLYCAGHTHGGQVALPFYGALTTLSKFGKKYEAGLYREGQTFLYVNRGIGMEGGPAPRVRFCARPEVTVIEISPE
jgi:predicted MPP superfamily phosphohydrolase